MTLPELLEYVKAGGGILAPVFAILFWLERDERKAAQQELKLMAKETAVSISELKGVIGHLVSIFKPGSPA